MYLSEIVISKDKTKARVFLDTLKGQTIKFDPGLNFLVGENGVGKSSILSTLSNCAGDIKPLDLQYKIVGKGKLSTYFFDTEKMNPRVKGRIDTELDIISRFKSHGQCLFQYMQMLEQILKEPDHTRLVLVDEPESGISPWNQVKIRDIFAKVSEHQQLIVATHSTILTQASTGTVIYLGKKTVYCTPASKFKWF
jgi:predicted ATPase